MNFLVFTTGRFGRVYQNAYTCSDISIARIISSQHAEKMY